VDETATDSATFFGPPGSCGAADFRPTRIAWMQFPPRPPRPPSIDQGVIALIWAVGLAVYIYFGLIAVGASGATAIVIALVSLAGIWLLVRLRGEDTPVRRRPNRRQP
jgi:hypothetical protein